MPNFRSVLAIDPFHGGSHRAFVTSAADRSQHSWNIIAGKPVHWKWRMRSAPLTLVAPIKHHLQTDGLPDVVFCTDMLDVPAWLGMMRRSGIDRVPLILYFHENQWTYPATHTANAASCVAQPSSRHRVDHHYGYTNLLSAIAADTCVFNSKFHRQDFLEASIRFVSKMPDGKSDYDWKKLEEKCCVIAPGFVKPDETVLESNPSKTRMRIGWVSRWEADKRPDRLLDFCNRLQQGRVEFELILLGARPATEPQSLTDLRRHFGSRIVFDGFASSKEAYWRWLQQMDLVVSFADHEFFGIAICEAVHAGAIPIVPNRLSYPETTPELCRYESAEDAVRIAKRFSDAKARDAIRGACQLMISKYEIHHTVNQLDELIAEM